MTHEELMKEMAKLEKQLETASTAEEIVRISKAMLALHDANPIHLPK